MSFELFVMSRRLIQEDLEAAKTALTTGVFDSLYNVGRLQGRIDGLTAALNSLDSAQNTAYEDPDD